MATLAIVVSVVPMAAQTRTPTPPKAAARGADGYVTARRLGGATSFHKPALTNAASVKRMAATKGMEADIRNVMADSGLSRTADAVVAMLANAPTPVVGGNCADAAPIDGTLVECEFSPGSTLEWMAYRPDGARGNRTSGRIEKVRWGGRSPFKALLFRITTTDSLYTFLVPKICGNLSLMSVRDVARPMAAPLPAPAPPPAPVVAPPPAPPPPPPAIEPPAPLPPAPPQAPMVKANPFFVDALFGKDRRVRPIAGRTTGDGGPVNPNTGPLDFAQCSPMIGLKFGVAKRFQNNWELAGAAGLAMSLVSADHKVREHEVLVDVEANKYLRNGSFVGTGLSLWDITHSDTFTPAVLLHFGVPLGNHPNHQIYFLGEGRLLLDHADDVANNYQFWAGVRIHLGRR